MKRGLGVSHGSQEWGGNGLGRLKMKHEKGVASWFTRVRWEGLGKAQNGSQECCGNGLGRPKMKHEKGVACFMVPKSGVGRAWER